MTRRPIETVLLVAVGGSVGATLRYAVALALPALAGTLAANVLGSFALGALVSAGDRVPPRVRLALGGGLLSSFTTYSTFAVQTLTVSPPLAAGYVLASLALGFGVARLAGRLVAPGRDGLGSATGEHGETDAAGESPETGGDRP